MKPNNRENGAPCEDTVRHITTQIVKEILTPEERITFLKNQRQKINRAVGENNKVRHFENVQSLY